MLSPPVRIAPRHGEGVLHRSREHPARQPVDAVVGDPHGVVFVLEGDHDEHRSEDLLLGDGHGVVHVDEERGLHPVALGELVARRPPPPTRQRGTLGLALLDVPEHPFALLGPDQRALRTSGRLGSP